MAQSAAPVALDRTRVGAETGNILGYAAEIRGTPHSVLSDAVHTDRSNAKGRMEIWLALKAACETEDLGLAQAIIDSAQITVPTGELSRGAYDVLGNRYVVPEYCYQLPLNLHKSLPAVKVSQRKSLSPPLSPQQSSGKAQKLRLVCRLSDNQPDIELAECLLSDEISEIKQRLFKNSPGLQSKTIRIFSLGRLLKDSQTVNDALPPTHANGGQSPQNCLILQVMVS